VYKRWTHEDERVHTPQLLAALIHVISNRATVRDPKRSETLQKVISFLLWIVQPNRRRTDPRNDSYLQSRAEGPYLVFTDVQHANAKILTSTNSHSFRRQELPQDWRCSRKRTGHAELAKKKWLVQAEFFKFGCLSCRRRVLALRGQASTKPRWSD
jgi:hypothetical protein